MTANALQVAKTDPELDRKTFLNDVRDGLRRMPKSLPCKYFYDSTGSALFDKICELPEYYLTRVELLIMRQHAEAIGRHIGGGVLLIEYGSGSGIKSRLLLNNVPAPVFYVPIDISREHMEQSEARLALEFPHVEILPVCADFTHSFEVPEPSRAPNRRVVYFPGSTIGNFEVGDAVGLLTQIADVCGMGGGLLIGVDLKKDVREIEAAYNDSRGITAEFNLNLLRRINRDLGGNFNVEHFRHRAVYDVQRGRVELGLVSKRRQLVSIAGEEFCFDFGEEIRTEYSHKYTVEEFSQVAGLAGFELDRHWSDARRRFAVFYFHRSGTNGRCRPSIGE